MKSLKGLKYTVLEKTDNMKVLVFGPPIHKIDPFIDSIYNEKI
jgi:hypothetical protein